MPILALTNDEAALVRYALREMANKRAEQALDARCHNAEHLSRDFAQANADEARKLTELANRLTEA